MKKRQITINLLDPSSATAAIQKLTAERAQLESRAKLLTERLAEFGGNEARVKFTNAWYDGLNDVNVSVEPTDAGYAIVANGNAVCFIEFGTGVVHNGAGGNYPLPKPEEVVNIGEYGKGFGKHRGWSYEGEPGTNGRVIANGQIFTRGNPANMPMWYASETIKSQLLTIAREVFG